MRPLEVSAGTGRSRNEDGGVIRNDSRNRQEDELLSK